MRRGAVTLLVTGVLLTLLPVGWWLTRSPAEEGGDAAEQLAASPPAASLSAPSRPAGPTASPEPVPEPESVAVVPVRLSIPAIGVEARVVPAGLESGTGEMEVPRAVDVVGWYRHGPALAEPAGSTVVAGHVDDAEQGPGAFFRLRDLGRDQRFTVTGSDGSRRRYRVVAREVFSKERMPLDRLFARDGAPRLTLITCGGDFDRSRRSYRDNIVVTAVEEGRR
jgi:sortase (surface protein transpeptidase)